MREKRHLSKVGEKSPIIIIIYILINTWGTKNICDFLMKNVIYRVQNYGITMMIEKGEEKKRMATGLKAFVSY